jgi:hypothetical protein
MRACPPHPSRRALRTLLRMRRLTTELAAHLNRAADPNLTMSNSPSRSRARISASGLCLFASLTRIEGVGGAPRDVRVLGGTPGGHAMTRRVRRLARRLASHDAGRSPLGAPPWRFWALRVPRFPLRVTRLCRSFGGSGSVTASSSRPGLNAWRAGSLPPGAAVASRRRRTPHLAPHSGCLENTPSLSKAANLLVRMHSVVSGKMRFVAENFAAAGLSPSWPGLTPQVGFTRLAALN